MRSRLGWVHGFAIRYLHHIGIPVSCWQQKLRLAKTVNASNSEPLKIIFVWVARILLLTCFLGKLTWASQPATSKLCDAKDWWKSHPKGPQVVMLVWSHLINLLGLEAGFKTGLRGIILIHIHKHSHCNNDSGYWQSGHKMTNGWQRLSPCMKKDWRKGTGPQSPAKENLGEARWQPKTCSQCPKIAWNCPGARTEKYVTWTYEFKDGLFVHQVANESLNYNERAGNKWRAKTWHRKKTHKESQKRKALKQGQNSNKNTPLEFHSIQCF